MIKNWKLFCHLSSPLAGEPPALDAILEFELARRLGIKTFLSLDKRVPLSEIKRVPIPICQKTIGGHELYCTSDPILPKPIDEWNEYLNKRLDSDMISVLLNPIHMKSLLVASGPYKMRHTPVRVRLIEKIAWFFRGDRAEVNKLLKGIASVGRYRGVGYALVKKWEYEEQEEDNSIFAIQNGQRILMKTIPANHGIEKLKGYRFSHGGAFPPYWHPGTHMEVCVPC